MEMTILQMVCSGKKISAALSPGPADINHMAQMLAGRPWIIVITSGAWTSAPGSDEMQQPELDDLHPSCYPAVLSAGREK